jgi:putative membrane protein
MRMITRLIADHGGTIARGVLMGGADIIPGVSGGTVALIVGIYERLVTAISHFDLQWLRMLGARRWREAALHVDLPLLVPLAMGILLGFVGMTILMHFLLSTEQTRSLTMAMFFGLIFASGFVVALMIHVRSGAQLAWCVVMGLLGAALAWWICGLQTVTTSSPHLAFIFFTGALAICAMILPGISGAMLLLILGVYLHLTEIPGNVLRGHEVLKSLATALTFAAGCAVGLLSFSKVLRWLLRDHHAVTMAVLCGFMFGSLRKLWPFQRDLTPMIEKVKFKTFEPIMPPAWDAQVTGVLIVFLLAVLAVWSVDWFAHGHSRRLLRRVKSEV